MNTLALTLLDSSSVVRVEDVTSLVATDASGQFGLQSGHADFVTVLEPGLFRFRTIAQTGWSYAAGAGGLLRCIRAAGRTEVRIVSARILRGSDPQDLQSRLGQMLEREGALRVSTRENRMQMELALFKRLERLARKPA